MRKDYSKPRTSLFTKRCKKPNFLILMVDEQRYPTIYENEDIKKWSKENLLVQELLRENGFEFKNHYAGSTACSPSRTTLYTGQYPSLHGVTQTSGAAKTPFDPDMFWLDPNTVPTMGDYLRKAGYRTYWKGKWHASEVDIIIPGTNNALPSYTSTGVPDKENVQEYLEASRLNEFGFNGWIGPEPHGANPRNSGSSAAIGISGRDVVYADEVVDLIHCLEQEEKEETPPWMIMSSFINPHDIALFGVIAEQLPLYNFEIDPSVPFIPKAPTSLESLHTKPRAQSSYRDVYPKALQPLIDTPFYRKLYYSLQKQADNEMMKVFQALKKSIFYEDTIVLFLSDHGDLLGAHGELYQKWYNMYEESIHVPLIIHSPSLFSGKESTTMLTSHVDVLPTMLGLAGIDEEEVQEMLSLDHTEVHPLVGRDLSPLLSGRKRFYRANEPLYFMTDDDVTRGANQVTVTGEPYESVIQPNHIEAVITTLPTGADKKKEIWKYGRYYDNPQFWSNPGVSDVTVTQSDPVPPNADEQFSECITTTKTTPVPDEFELYNLTVDPLEEKNLAHPDFETPESKEVQKILNLVLEEQCRQKRLSPSSGTVPGMPPCEFT
ncbi:sulfatase-like hydrolase/transferase [Guptibacillus hwajinpoensis]|uniref:sulfatase-like hydrolase/transferase n=1 Tax=Guptibacillus hwajinpoensis TaxID=208199 RepID=UPI001CFE5DC7|nr:sulfatase-like hydrolase/transferase [Pseudalkalibacillus hwajinpoensis]WLR58952.1 sulfatase-like hydrolase/transferase [Pseudalkalibacillus hwajinpoensis]